MPPKRREYGSGSLSQRSSDGLWIGTIEAGVTASGSRRRIRVAAKTRSEAATKLKNKMREINEHGLPAAGVSVRDTVKAWAEQWLAITERTARPTTMSTNASCIKLWVIPTIGHRRLDAITPADIRAVADEQRKKGRAPSTVLRTHAVMTTMLKAALVEGHRISPRIFAMPRPTTNTSDRDAIPLADALALLEKAAQRPDRSRWLAALAQGIRQGERLGLTWDCVDLDSPVPAVDISWQLQSLPYRHGCEVPCGKAAPKSCPSRQFRVPDGYERRQVHKALHLTRPKTERGKRIIPLVPAMAQALRDWRAVAPGNAAGLVWPLQNGRPTTPSDENADWISLQDAAQVARVDGTVGRRYDGHEMRHTAASILLQARTPQEVIKAILGHSSYAASMIYTHADQDQAAAALTAVGDRLQLR